MKNYYQNAIEGSKLKQQLMQTGIKALMHEANPEIETIERAITLLKEEQTNQLYYEEKLAEEISGEAKKKEEAKKALGLA